MWSLPASASRAYAAVSGDVNPIHMSALTAKAFGFPRAIAHGMYTAARALSEYEADPEVLARRAMGIAAEVCVFTNDRLTVESVG